MEKVEKFWAFTTPQGNCPDGQPHIFREYPGAGGFPDRVECGRCLIKAPEPFCRQPGKCCAAGRCLSDPVCND